MKFTVKTKDKETAARTGELTLARGTVQTPVYMPVATRAAVRAVSAPDLDDLGFEIILSNTYHLYIRPGIELLEKTRGLHGFMNFSTPLLTDSGGFQVFSLANLCKVREEGVEFRSHLDGSLHHFTPEKVLDIQRVIGSDIMMVLDQCTEYPIAEKKAAAAVDRTLQWAGSSAKYWRSTFDTEKQNLFAIVQGSVYEGLRKGCAESLAELDLPGYAIGGLSVGEPGDLYRDITAFTAPLLPADKPKYMMGVGSPLEILHAVEWGIDMFDSVMPTRIARNGTLYTSQGRVNIKSSKYTDDLSPLDPLCGCYVCQRFTRAYLRHIFRMGEISALIYNTYHNLYFMKSFMSQMREAIDEGRFREFHALWLEKYRN